MSFKYKALPLAISLAIGAASLPAAAMQISITSTSHVETTFDSLISSHDEGPAPSINSNSSITDDGDEASATAIANDSGEVSVFSHASHVNAGSLSILRQTATITNDSATAQLIDFSFLIPQTILQSSLQFNVPLTAGHSVESAYSAQILLNNASLWDTAATLRIDDQGVNYITSGTDLNETLNDGWSGLVVQYQTDAYAGNLNLGVIGAGETVTLEYILSASASSHTYGSLSKLGYGGLAAIYDPFGFNSTPFFSEDKFTLTETSESTQVTEPSGLLLAGAGLAALAFRRRNKKK